MKSWNELGRQLAEREAIFGLSGSMWFQMMVLWHIVTYCDVILSLKLWCASEHSFQPKADRYVYIFNPSNSSCGQFDSHGKPKPSVCLPFNAFYILLLRIFCWLVPNDWFQLSHGNLSWIRSLENPLPPRRRCQLWLQRLRVPLCFALRKRTELQVVRLQLHDKSFELVVLVKPGCFTGTWDAGIGGCFCDSRRTFLEVNLSLLSEISGSLQLWSQDLATNVAKIEALQREKPNETDRHEL